jgi:transposase
MSKTRKTYTAEFKLQAVRMVADQHLAVAEVARRLGVSEGRLHDWLKAYRAGGAEAFTARGLGS